MHLVLKWKEPINETRSQQDQSLLLDQEVDLFSKWLAELPDDKAKGALSRPERALIKTYLVQKLTGKLGES